MSNRIVLVTGANQGLGLAIIEGKEAAKELQAKVPQAQILVIKLDVTDDNYISVIVEQVNKEYGKLDVLINNASQCIRPTNNSPQALRKAFNDNCNVNLTSVAVLTEAFLPLLHKAPAPKVLNITSGLGSIHNALTSKMRRFPEYGGAKVGMNGLTAHQQARELDRVEAEALGSQPKSEENFVRWYIVNPGVMKTAFNGYLARGRDPRESAEPDLRIAFDDKDEYHYARSWEWVEGKMRIVPW